MGMFDYVEYTADCWSCGKALKDFQSKDGECFMRTILPSAVRGFYTSCDHCKAWNEFQVVVESYQVVRIKQKDREGDS